MVMAQEVVLVAPQDREEELTVRLGRIGFDRVAGYPREPEAAFRTASDRVDRADRLTARQLATALIGPLPPVLLDVRNAGELAGGAIFHARHNARRAAGAARGDPATAAGRRVLRGRLPVQRGREPAAPSR